MGTPEFAVPTLRRLCEQGLTPLAVYSQPSRPLGRGLHMTPPPVACEANARGIPLYQPEVLQCAAELERLRELAPDLIVTVAYGKIFRRRLLALPRLGCLNLHPSLLPRYRGLAPIPWAILRGDAATGVTLYQMTSELDAGPIVAQEVVAIEPHETAAELSRRLSDVGAALTCSGVRAWLGGARNPEPQDAHSASYAPRLERQDGLIDWRLPANQLVRLVRALDPWPGAFTYCRQTRLKVLAISALDERARRMPPGTILQRGGCEPPVVATLPGAVALLRVQPENCRPQDGTAFCCGARLRIGDRLLPRPSERGNPGDA